MKTTITRLRSVRAAYAGVRRHPYLWRWDAHWELLEPIYVRGVKSNRDGKKHGAGRGQIPPVCHAGQIVSANVLRSLGVVPHPGLP